MRPRVRKELNYEHQFLKRSLRGEVQEGEEKAKQKLSVEMGMGEGGDTEFQDVNKPNVKHVDQKTTYMLVHAWQ